MKVHQVVAVDGLGHPLAGVDVEGSQQRGRPVASVLELLAAGPTRFRRRGGGEALLGLDPGLLVDRHHQGV